MTSLNVGPEWQSFAEDLRAAASHYPQHPMAYDHTCSKKSNCHFYRYCDNIYICARSLSHPKNIHICNSACPYRVLCHDTWTCTLTHVDVPIEETNDNIPSFEQIPLLKIIQSKEEKINQATRKLLAYILNYAVDNKSAFIESTVRKQIATYAASPTATAAITAYTSAASGALDAFIDSKQLLPPCSFIEYATHFEYLRLICTREFDYKVDLFNQSINDLTHAINVFWSIMHPTKKPPSERILILFIFVIIWFFKTGDVCPFPKAPCLFILSNKPKLIDWIARYNNYFKSKAFTANYQQKTELIADLEPCQMEKLTEHTNTYLSVPFLCPSQVEETLTSYPPQ